jgi:hypothetical protein
MTFTAIENLILVRLLVSNKDFTSVSEIRKALGNFFPATWQDREIKMQIEESLNNLKLKAAISRNQRKSSIITDSGSQQALFFLNIKELPIKMDWEKFKSLYLPALALNVTLNSDSEIKWFSKPDGFRSATLTKIYGLPLNHTQKPSLIKAVESLLIKPLSLSKTGIGAMRTAVIRQWLEEEVLAHNDKKAEAIEVTELAAEQVKEFDSKQFIQDVLDTAGECETGWFGDNKVFISHVWQDFSQKHPEYNLDEKTFKKYLVDSDRSVLSRADLVSVMNPKDVAESETHYLDAIFHFIRVERR